MYVYVSTIEWLFHVHDHNTISIFMYACVHGADCNCTTICIHVTGYGKTDHIRGRGEGIYPSLQPQELQKALCIDILYFV